MPIPIILWITIIIWSAVITISLVSLFFHYIWNKSVVDNKFAIWDKVIIKRWIYRWKEWIIFWKAFDYKTYHVTIDGKLFNQEIHEDHMEFYDLNKILSS